MYDEYKNRIKSRIMWMDVSAVLLVLLILFLVFGFLGMVIGFDYIFNPKASVISDFSDEAWRFRNTITESEKNIEFIKNNKTMTEHMKSIGFQNNIFSLNESIKLATGHLEELTKAIYGNQSKIIDLYLNEKRILFILSGFFVAYLVKLFVGLYKYNAYVKVHYITILDALELLISGREVNEPIDLNRFNEVLKFLSVKDLQIDQGGSLLEGLMSKIGKSSDA